MAIPSLYAITLPFLELLGDGEMHGFRSAVSHLEQHFGMTDGEKNELVPSGKQTRLVNRIGWARTELKHAGLVEYPSRGSWRITERGREVLKLKPDKIDRAFLMQFGEYQNFYGHSPSYPQIPDNFDLSEEVAETTPQETLDAAYQTIRKTLADEILETVKQCSPQFFERLVVDLLVKMGYGGSLEEAAKVIGKSGDGGIDGIINEDRLGLESIYIQAKRWNNVTVGRPEVQQFVGALQGQKALKGVFITTSKFTDGAKQYADSLERKVVLIDGSQLAGYMIEYDIGVETEVLYKLKRINPAYFDEQ